eukprot:g77804.t1
MPKTDNSLLSQSRCNRAELAELLISGNPFRVPGLSDNAPPPVDCLWKTTRLELISAFLTRQPQVLRVTAIIKALGVLTWPILINVFVNRKGDAGLVVNRRAYSS